MERLGALRAGPPEVTVVVPTFNHERYVRQTILSILNQAIDVEVEVVVHDDASTDATPKLLRDLYAEHSERLTVILQSENQTQLGTPVFASLLLAVKSRYLALCEGDDLWTDPTKLKRQLDFMVANPWCTLSHHGVSVLNEGGNFEYERDLVAMLSDPSRTRMRVAGMDLARGNFILSCSAMLRRDALRDEALERCAGLEDLFVFALAAEAGDVGYLPEIMATYRLHSSNLWSGLSAAERFSTEIETRWLMAAHLRGPMQLAVREALIDLLFESAAHGKLESVKRRLREHSELLSAHQELHRAYGELAELQAQALKRVRSLEAQAILDAGRVADAESVAASLQASLDMIQRSRSWTVTKPLRAAGSRFHQHRQSG